MGGRDRKEFVSDRPASPDPGVSNERTSLAWNRTGLALGALGGALIRLASDLDTLAVVGYVLGAVVVAGAGCVWAYGYFGYQRNMQVLAGGRRPLARTLALKVITVATTIAAAGALALALLGLGKA